MNLSIKNIHYHCVVYKYIYCHIDFKMLLCAFCVILVLVSFIYLFTCLFFFLAMNLFRKFQLYIYISKTILAMKTEVELSTGDQKVCVIPPCVHYQRQCRLTRKKEWWKPLTIDHLKFQKRTVLCQKAQKFDYTVVTLITHTK